MSSGSTSTAKSGRFSFRRSDTIAAVLDLSWVHAELAPHYPDNGRPSIDPELMIRMLIIGYVFAIRSERALCRDVQVNLFGETHTSCALAPQWRCASKQLLPDKFLLAAVGDEIDAASKQPFTFTVTIAGDGHWCQ